MTTLRQTGAHSLIDASDLTLEAISQVLKRGQEIKQHFRQQRAFPLSLSGRQIVLLFTEASTRTKFSFQMAAQRLGAQCLISDDVRSSSMSKGETFADTFATLAAMGPDLFVIRGGEDIKLKELAAGSKVPIINAGYATDSHPTQALLDVMTILEHRPHLHGEKILLVGDIRHSRVASSLYRFLRLMGAEVGYYAPSEFLPKATGEAKIFDDLKQGASWATVFYGLRVQFERHKDTAGFSQKDYIKHYSLTEENLPLLAPGCLIMHPGPVNWGIEFSECVRTDPRLTMWQQKENGVYLRAALLEKFTKREQT